RTAVTRALAGLLFLWTALARALLARIPVHALSGESRDADFTDSVAGAIQPRRQHGAIAIDLVHGIGEFGSNLDAQIVIGPRNDDRHRAEITGIELEVDDAQCRRVSLSRIGLEAGCRWRRRRGGLGRRTEQLLHAV